MRGRPLLLPLEALLLATSLLLAAPSAAAYPAGLAALLAARAAPAPLVSGPASRRGAGAAPLPPWDAPPAPPRDPAACPHARAGARRWHDPATWPDGRVPAAGADVAVPAGPGPVVLDANATAGKVTVPAGAELVVRNADAAAGEVALSSTGIAVEGALRVGAPACREAGRVAFDLRGDRPAAGAPDEPADKKGILVTGAGVLALHGAAPGRTWTRLALAAAAGDGWLVVAEEVGDWAAGQELVVVTSHYKDTRDFHRNERRTLASAPVRLGPDLAGGDVYYALELDAPLDFYHAANPHFQAEVALLSRPVVVRGAAGDSRPAPWAPPFWDATNGWVSGHVDGYGAHVMVAGAAAAAELSGVELLRVGQTNRLARYPIHFHLAGEAGARSRVSDCSIHESFYRCVAVHGTHGLRVERNVAFNATGFCYYLEDGVEERNEFRHNLAAHIHPIINPATGRMAGAESFTGTIQDLVVLQNDTHLKLPADVSAAGFYVTNPYNTYVGNAAVGGWSGFAFPALDYPIKNHRHLRQVRPRKRPTGLFDGNVIHSTGYFWANGGAIYSGGELRHVADGDDRLEYLPGRGMRKPTGDTAWTPAAPETDRFYLVFKNTRVWASTTGVLNWGDRSEIRGFETYDVAHRSAFIFGSHLIHDAHWHCVTPYAPYAAEGEEPDDSASARKHRPRGRVPFSWYDTGQKHMLEHVRMVNCTNAAEDRAPWNFLTHSDQFLPEFMQATRNITYEPPLDALPAEARGEQLELFKINKFLQNYTGPTCTPPGSQCMGAAMALMEQSWLDTDGTASGTGERTIIASQYANDWWRLDPDCRNLGSHFLTCSAAGGRSVGGLKVQWDPARQVDLNNGGEIGDTGNLAKCSNGKHKPCPRLGWVSHFGRSPEAGLPITFNAELVGALNGFGWGLTWDAGAPKSLVLHSIQVPWEARLLVSVPYPPGTTFAIVARAASWCQPASFYCEHDFAAASSLDEVREAPGDRYFFDGSFLYLRPVFIGPGSLGQAAWDPELVVRRETFTRSGTGFVKVSQGNVPPAKVAHISVTASCPAGADPLFCDLPEGQPRIPPAPCDGADAFAYDRCGPDRPPEPPAPPSPPPPLQSPPPQPPAAPSPPGANLVPDGSFEFYALKLDSGCGGWTKGQGWAGYPGCGARTFTDPAGDLANTGTRAAHFYMGGGVSAFKYYPGKHVCPDQADELRFLVSAAVRTAPEVDDATVRSWNCKVFWRGCMAAQPEAAVEASFGAYRTYSFATAPAETRGTWENPYVGFQCDHPGPVELWVDDVWVSYLSPSPPPAPPSPPPPSPPPSPPPPPIGRTAVPAAELAEDLGRRELRKPRVSAAVALAGPALADFGERGRAAFRAAVAQIWDLGSADRVVILSIRLLPAAPGRRRLRGASRVEVVFEVACESVDAAEALGGTLAGGDPAAVAAGLRAAGLRSVEAAAVGAVRLSEDAGPEEADAGGPGAAHPERGGAGGFLPYRAAGIGMAVLIGCLILGGIGYAARAGLRGRAARGGTGFEMTGPRSSLIPNPVALRESGVFYPETARPPSRSSVTIHNPVLEAA